MNTSTRVSQSESSSTVLYPTHHRERVVVTGCGVVCALGNSVPELTLALRTGQSGVRLVASDPAGQPCVAACPLMEGSYPELCAADRALFDPVTRYAMHAAVEALEQSALLTEHSLLANTGVYIGTALGGMSTVEEIFRDIWYHGTAPKPLSVVCAMSNAPAAHLSIRFGLKGPNLTYATGCASATMAIGQAFNAIREGRLNCALVGGTEACVTNGVVRSWQAMRLLANVDRKLPSEACRPFSRDRSGCVLGEGAAMLVLESLDVATARGAPILCELLGFGSNSDASHICIPSMEGQAAAMSGALVDAQLAPADIDYLNAHGCATRISDVTETKAIRQAFGASADRLAVSSTKSVHGHLLGASGALEFAVSLIGLREQFLPATMHLREADPDCDLDYVANVPRLGVEMRNFMSNSFAFGGSNAVVVAGHTR
ncbi:MAG: beta-ketoacyl-[acyl-carrier-protein] synthase family protein [Gammaproteobacteria bacterium]